MLSYITSKLGENAVPSVWLVVDKSGTVMKASGNGSLALAGMAQPFFFPLLFSPCSGQAWIPRALGAGVLNRNIVLWNAFALFSELSKCYACPTVVHVNPGTCVDMPSLQVRRPTDPKTRHPDTTDTEIARNAQTCAYRQMRPPTHTDTQTDTRMLGHMPVQTHTNSGTRIYKYRQRHMHVSAPL